MFNVFNLKIPISPFSIFYLKEKHSVKMLMLAIDLTRHVLSKTKKTQNHDEIVWLISCNRWIFDFRKLTRI